VVSFGSVVSFGGVGRVDVGAASARRAGSPARFERLLLRSYYKCVIRVTIRGELLVTDGRSPVGRAGEAPRSAGCRTSTHGDQRLGETDDLLAGRCRSRGTGRTSRRRSPARSRARCPSPGARGAVTNERPAGRHPRTGGHREELEAREQPVRFDREVAVGRLDPVVHAVDRAPRPSRRGAGDRRRARSPSSSRRGRTSRAAARPGGCTASPTTVRTDGSVDSCGKMLTTTSSAGRTGESCQCSTVPPRSSTACRRARGSGG